MPSQSTSVITTILLKKKKEGGRLRLREVAKSYAHPAIYAGCEL